MAELGSGSGKKTRWLLEALTRRQRTTYCPIELSPAALARCESELGQIESVSIVGFERPYLDGLLAAASRRQKDDHLLVLFLGSTIGNFDRDAAERFLTEVRRILYPGDALLLGTDLEKPLPQLLAAYDDSLGVTAAFNLNLLARINRELGADFDLAAFRHEARYNSSEQRVEMHLRSTARSDRPHSPRGMHRVVRERRNHLDGKFAQIPRRRYFRDGEPERIYVRLPVDRFGVAFRGELADRGIVPACLQKASAFPQSITSREPRSRGGLFPRSKPRRRSDSLPTIP